MNNKKLDLKSKLLYRLLKMSLPHFKCPHCNLKGITLGQKFFIAKRTATRCHLCYEKVVVSQVTILSEMLGAVLLAYLYFKFIHLENKSRNIYFVFLLITYLFMNIFVSILIPVKKSKDDLNK